MKYAASLNIGVVLPFRRSDNWVIWRWIIMSLKKTLKKCCFHAGSYLLFHFNCHSSEAQCQSFSWKLCSKFSNFQSHNFPFIVIKRIEKKIYFTIYILASTNVLCSSSIWTCRISNIHFDFFNCTFTVTFGNSKMVKLQYFFSFRW